MGRYADSPQPRFVRNRPRHSCNPLQLSLATLVFWVPLVVALSLGIAIWLGIRSWLFLLLAGPLVAAIIQWLPPRSRRVAIGAIAIVGVVALVGMCSVCLVGEYYVPSEQRWPGFTSIMVFLYTIPVMLGVALGQWLAGKREGT